VDNGSNKETQRQMIGGVVIGGKMDMCKGLRCQEDADWKNIQAFIHNDIFLEIQMPNMQKGKMWLEIQLCRRNGLKLKSEFVTIYAN
jgi:hypothetical protein